MMTKTTLMFHEHGCLNAGEQHTIECGCRHHQLPGIQWRAPPTKPSVIDRKGVGVDAEVILLCCWRGEGGLITHTVGRGTMGAEVFNRASMTPECAAVYCSVLGVLLDRV